MSAEPSRSPRGRSARARAVTEFLATGGATPLLFLLSFVLRKTLGLDRAEYAVGFTMFYAANVVNNPHFAVSYLLFYEDARGRAFGGTFRGAQRARYLFAGLVVPLVLGVWAVYGLWAKSAVALGWMIQVMFFTVGWHYVKQGFGVLSVLAARRGVAFTPRERLALLGHAFAGWAYAWASPADRGTEVEEKGVVYTTLAHGPLLERVTYVVFVASLIPVAVLLVKRRLRDGRVPLFTPFVAYFCSIWVWSVYSGLDPLVRYMVPALHSLQYLFMVHLLKSNQAEEREGPPHFEMSKKARLGVLSVSAVGLAWLLFHGVPEFLDGALVPKKSAFTDLGATPYFAALYTFVNVHHYFMDTVIWRRENPLTRYLRDPVKVAPEPAAEPSGVDRGAAEAT